MDATNIKEWLITIGWAWLICGGFLFVCLTLEMAIKKEIRFFFSDLDGIPHKTDHPALTAFLVFFMLILCGIAGIPGLFVYSEQRSHSW